MTQAQPVAQFENRLSTTAASVPAVGDGAGADAHAHSHDHGDEHGHSHDHGTEEHGHTHEHLEHAGTSPLFVLQNEIQADKIKGESTDRIGKFAERDMPDYSGRDWTERAFTIGIGG
jgi:urease accessory protein